MAYSIKPLLISDLIIMMEAVKTLQCSLCCKEFSSDAGDTEEEFAESLIRDGFKTILTEEALYVCCKRCVIEVIDEQSSEL